MKYAIAGLFTAALVIFSSRARAEDDAVNEQKPTEPAPIAHPSGIIGVDNNNPLNIRETGDAWEGLDNPRAKKGFFNFKAPKWGFRAAAKIILVTYPTRYGVETIGDVIRRWAPPSENATDDYISYVVSRTKLPATTRVDRSNIAPIMAAMARAETGTEWPTADIINGVELL